MLWCEEVAIGLNGGDSDSGVAEFEQHMLRLLRLRYLTFLVLAGILISFAKSKRPGVKENDIDAKKLSFAL